MQTFVKKLSVVVLIMLNYACHRQPLTSNTNDSLILPNEKHFKNMRQLTFGGDNAEAYFSFDNQSLVFQRTKADEGIQCDQIFMGKIPQKPTQKFEPTLQSNGKGRTTCSYFMKGDKQIIYASTHEFDEACPPVPDRKKIGKYVWPIYPEFELYVKNISTNETKRLTQNKFYDAEATISPNGKQIVFTSTRNGDLDLYIMDSDGNNLKQLTFDLGYDGGAFFSPDGKQLVFRASRFDNDADRQTYKDLLAQNMVTPSNMELYIINTDGTGLKKITNLGNANWAPYWHPSGKKIIFASNHLSPRGFPFNLYMINTDGSNLERITNSDQFDAFPMFSHDGKKIVFCSNRNNGGGHDTNIFIADWVE